MSGDSYIRGKDKNQLLNELKDTAMPGSEVYEQMRMAIFVRTAEDLEKSISNLSVRVTALDVALKIASIVGGLATLLIAYKTFFP